MGNNKYFSKDKLWGFLKHMHLNKKRKKKSVYNQFWTSALQNVHVIYLEVMCLFPLGNKKKEQKFTARHSLLLIVLAALDLLFNTEYRKELHCDETWFPFSYVKVQ